jgi:hypothetical protein
MRTFKKILDLKGNEGAMFGIYSLNSSSLNTEKRRRRRRKFKGIHGAYCLFFIKNK